MAHVFIAKDTQSEWSVKNQIKVNWFETGFHIKRATFCFLPGFTSVDWEGRPTSYFHFMTNVTISIPISQIFHFLNSNIPDLPAYGVFISQLIRYARACSSYGCFIPRATRLWTTGICLIVFKSDDYTYVLCIDIYSTRGPRWSSKLFSRI